MVVLLTGENNFEINREIRRIIDEFAGNPEKIDGSEVELRQLPDLLMGTSLFGEKRLVIIKNLSDNTAVWQDFTDWLPRVSDDITLVLVEPKPDKRTRTYKELLKASEVKEFALWGERDNLKAEQWAVEEAKRLGFNLDKPLAKLLIARTGLDQWRVYHALEKLSVLDDVTKEIIELLVDQNPSENVFQLFETALKGQTEKLHDAIRTLEKTEDPYKVFGLLGSQAFQFSTLATADKSSGEVAKDLGAHPFVLSKLSSYAKKQGKAGARKAIAAFADADEAMKTSVAEPWLLIERALLKISEK